MLPLIEHRKQSAISYITRAIGFKTARRKCEGEDSTVNRMNSTVI